MGLKITLGQGKIDVHIHNTGAAKRLIMLPRAEVEDGDSEDVILTKASVSDQGVVIEFTNGAALDAYQGLIEELGKAVNLDG